MDNKDDLAQGFPGRWWHAVENGRIKCDLCPRACVLKDGDRGFCFVRANHKNSMVLTTYGRSTGFCVDPIEKKPLNQFLPGSSILSFGTAGCNLGCRFCQNWTMSKAREVELLCESATPDQIAAAAVRLGCKSVAFTYNDPVIWAEYAIDTAKACHEQGVKAVAVTAGYISPEARKEFYSVIDAANVDLKAFTELFYQRLSLAHIEPVKETLCWLKHETNVWFEITTLLIPGENDSQEETARMCDWIVTNLGTDVPLHFTAFHPDFRLLDHPATPASTLQKARQIALSAGIRYVYTGNINDRATQSTYCHACKKLVIERDWYNIGAYKMKDNRCAHCNTAIPGIFDKLDGVWGRKRMSVRFGE